MSTLTIISIITFYANMYNVDPIVAISVAEQESQFNTNAVGSAGEIGLYQVKPQYVKDYTREQLFIPEVNIKVGIQKLAEAKKTCIHKHDITWVTCYNLGRTAARRIKHPELFPYVVNLNRRIASKVE